MTQADTTESHLKESYPAKLKVDSEREIWDESSDFIVINELKFKMTKMI